MVTVDMSTGVAENETDPSNLADVPTSFVLENSEIDNNGHSAMVVDCKDDDDDKCVSVTDKSDTVAMDIGVVNGEETNIINKIDADVMNSEDGLCRTASTLASDSLWGHSVTSNSVEPSEVNNSAASSNGDGLSCGKPSADEVKNVADISVAVHLSSVSLLSISQMKLTK